MKAVIKWVIVIIVFLLLISFVNFYFSIRPVKIISSINPGSYALTYEEVKFKTEDQLVLHGWFIPAKKLSAQTIILMHGYPADSGNILPSHLFLHSDYNLFFFDFRSMGKSEGLISSFGKDEVKDLKAAIQFLHHKGIHQVGVIGFSVGGAVAIMGAPQLPEIKALIAVSPYARLDWLASDQYHIPIMRDIMVALLKFWASLFIDMGIKDPYLNIGKLKIPTLIIISKDDRVITYKHAALLQQYAKDNQLVTFIIWHGLGHGQHAPDYPDIVKIFFNKHLKQ